MAISRGPKLVTNGLVLALDPSDDNSFAAQNLPIKNGLILWLDAADDDSFVYSSGTEVSQWRDKSGLNNHANQATVANQPSRNTVVNSRKSVNFSSANADRLRVNSGMVFTNSVTAIVFIKPGTQNFAYADILDQDHGMDGYNGWVIQRNNTASQWLVWLANEANTTWLNTNAISYTDNTPQIVTLRKGSSTLTLSSNGTSSGDVAIADQQIRQANYVGLNIGTWRAGNELHATSRHYNGEICEILVYNRALSLTEIKQVHNYLGQKWGILNTDRTIVDLSGNNNNGLLGNGTTADMPAFDAYNKGALKLDGTSDYIAVANATSLNPSTVTVSIWVKRNGYQSSVASYLRRNYNDAYAIIGDITADNVRFRIHNGSTYPESPNATLSLNEWTNIVGTYDLNNIKIYKNGVFVNQTAHTSAISYSSANTVLTIGRDDPVAGRYMNANYGSVLIYNRALSAAEILQNYNAQKGKYLNTIVQQGLVLNLDAGNPYSYAGAGTIWYDTSGNSFNGALTNGPVYSSTNSGIITFDGQNDYVDLSTSTLPISGNGARSIFVWMKTTATGLIGYVSTGTPASSQAFNLVKYSAGVGVMGYNNDYYPAAGAAGVTLTDGNWHYIGATFDGSNLRTYVDGILDNTSGAISYSTTGQYNYIGRSNHAGNENFLNGSIGLTQIYNRALSITEIVKNYNATKSRYGL